ncbi:MAG: metallophosphoesterase [Clostridia bacterium]|nr:metallophosphoesterase [Clostridia bacterium]
MKIMLVADVHQRTGVNKLRRKRTLRGLKYAFSSIDCDLIVFLGDLVHGPDYKDKERYFADLREVLDLTGEKPFAYVFGNHDDECLVTKEEILGVIGEYKNTLTDGRNYVLNIDSETLVFIDSGSYYDGEESCYDVVKEETILWAKSETEGKKAIAFQHIIVPDIIKLLDEKRGRKRPRFKQEVEYTGKLKERPCPPDINTGELASLAPNLKGMVFGHDHVNDFECMLEGVKIIQCAASGVNCYEYPQRPTVKLLDTETMTTEKIRI